MKLDQHLTSLHGSHWNCVSISLEGGRGGEFASSFVVVLFFTLAGCDFIIVASVRYFGLARTSSQDGGVEHDAVQYILE